MVTTRQNRIFVPVENNISRDWFVIYAEGMALGRLASVLAGRLRGKHKPYFSPHIDCGDYIIVVNAEKIRLTGRKEFDDTFCHTGVPGGIKNIKRKSYRKETRMTLQRGRARAAPKE